MNPQPAIDVSRCLGAVATFAGDGDWSDLPDAQWDRIRRQWANALAGEVHCFLTAFAAAFPDSILDRCVEIQVTPELVEGTYVEHILKPHHVAYRLQDRGDRPHSHRTYWEAPFGLQYSLSLGREWFADADGFHQSFAAASVALDSPEAHEAFVQFITANRDAIERLLGGVQSNIETGIVTDDIDETAEAEQSAYDCLMRYVNSPSPTSMPGDYSEFEIGFTLSASLTFDERSQNPLVETRLLMLFDMFAQYWLHGGSMNRIANYLAWMKTNANTG